ncbi:hypothetical protein [Streptomyces albicerus]|uniref:hypothetical protein n=1 Tax=Streptomyces albicerus TaxID=2569859 RepID=UPI00124BA924|nr:hypothetical protein [Streptomyces albicerus]
MTGATTNATDDFVLTGVLSPGTPDLLNAWTLLKALRDALEDEAGPRVWDTLERLVTVAACAKAHARPKTEFSRACRDADRHVFDQAGIPI